MSRPAARSSRHRRLASPLEINAEFRRVHGKNGILVKLAQAALDLPEEIVRRAICSVVGTRTLADIIAEAKANEKAFNTRVRTKLRGSYSHHYRRGLPKLLKAVTFGSSNETFQPVMDALALLKRYKDSDADFYDAAESVPFDYVVPDDWAWLGQMGVDTFGCVVRRGAAPVVCCTRPGRPGRHALVRITLGQFP